MAKTLRFILLFVPLDRNLAFHKLVAKVLVFSAMGHTIMHFVNYSFRPNQTLDLFGIWPWYSGGVICFSMLMIYSAAFDNVKRGQFEIFWYNHHFFLIFFGMILTHGKIGFNLNFWCVPRSLSLPLLRLVPLAHCCCPAWTHHRKWFVGPGVLYLLERCLRIYRAYQPVVVLSVLLCSLLRPVRCLESGCVI